MKYIMCRVQHEPPKTYGDCVRACVASILDKEPEQVPHFYESGEGTQAMESMREWLLECGLIPAYFPLSGESTLDDVLWYMEQNYSGHAYLIFCSTASGGDHCVIGHKGKVEHDPAWIKSPIIGPHSSGFWIITILAKI